MGVGPLIAAAGFLLLSFVDEGADYATQLLPGILLFGFGLAVTVAPLTSTILGAVEDGHSGVGSAVNNAVSRIAGLVAIAATSLVVGDSLDVEGFSRAAVATAALLIAGGVVSLLGIRNPAPADR
jgi:hypothetical protein